MGRGTLLRVCLAACVVVSLAVPAFAANPAVKPNPKAKATKTAANTGSAGKAGKSNKAGKRGHGKPAVMLERHVAGTKGGLPNVQALGALVIDESGHELFSRNPDRERPIASVSKLAAVLVVMERDLELDGLSTISKTDSEVARGGARSRLLEGMTVSNRDLLHAALLGSDNRAIPALGRAVKLTPSQLAAAMTAKAKDLGLVHTRFHDPTGLSPENVSTPRDTIVLLRTVMKQPVLAGITHRLSYEAHPVGRPPLTYNNTYKPAIRRGVEVLAGKTGYNDEARYCLVIATRIGGQNYFMSFLSNEGKLTRFGDVARVADWILQHKTKNPGEQVASTAPAGTPGIAGGAARAESTASSSSTASTATTTGAAVAPTPVVTSAIGPTPRARAEAIAAASHAPSAKTPGFNTAAPTTPPTPANTAPVAPGPLAPGPVAPGPVAPVKAPTAGPAPPSGPSPGPSVSPSVAPGVSPSVPVPTTTDAHVPSAAGMAAAMPASTRVAQTSTAAPSNRSP